MFKSSVFYRDRVHRTIKLSTLENYTSLYTQIISTAMSSPAVLCLSWAAALAVCGTLTRNTFVYPVEVYVEVKPAHRQSAVVISTKRQNLLFCDRIDCWVDSPFDCRPYTFYSWRPTRLNPDRRLTNRADQSRLHDQWRLHQPTMSALYREGRTVSPTPEVPVFLSLNK